MGIPWGIAAAYQTINHIVSKTVKQAMDKYNDNKNEQEFTQIKEENNISYFINLKKGK